jgi:pimeloyl-ACP methyl ester carboxylesterase
MVLTIAIAVPILAVVVYLGISAYVFNQLSHPHRSPVTTTPAEYRLAYQDVEFSSTDGIPLSGWYIDSPGSKVIVMMHGREGVRDGPPAMDIAALLAAHNYDVFMFDFRAHGNSGGDRYSLGQLEVRDVAGALDYLKARGVTAVGAFATSMGGATELRAAADHPEIKAIVTDSSFADLPELLETELPRASGLPSWFNPGIYLMGNLMFGIDLRSNKPAEVLAQLGDRPVFVIHSEVDTNIPVSHAYKLQAAGANNPNLQFWVAPGEGHCRAFMNNEEEYSRRLLEFYDKYLK